MSSPRTQGSLSQEEINEALNDEFRRDDSSSSSSSNDSASDKTVRLTKISPTQSATPLPSSRGMTPELSPSPYIAQPGSLFAKNATPSMSSRPLAALSSHYESLTNSNMGSPQPSATTDYSSPNSTVGSPSIWQIQYNNPPGSMVLVDGPLRIHPESLKVTLGLDDDTVSRGFNPF